ncbi:incomplete iron reductase [Laetiporus sulphureus 93-53]|uniref:ferric-chelate reductase (NADPH) n=1 Tax=Laetiporus sulphureus 93-53 TaxID=1314785 RepID=A0A165I7S7_9APHY|nr:incomplete iron reductase [Laetiporus sulphureus 93-53]KZT12697.1 incomplete iron reductase [Laetiporus sulphureus 93-53]
MPVLSTREEGGASGAAFNVDVLLFNINVALLCFAGLFVLLALPRAIARFLHSSEWFQGCFFHSVKFPASSRFLRTIKLDTNVSSAEKLAELRAIESTSSFSHYTHDGPAVSAVKVTMTDRMPAHMPGWTSMFPAITAALSWKVRPGYSVGELVILLAYTVVMFYASLVNVDLFTDPVRLGMVPTSQFPVLYIMATKNNVFGALIGMGYEKLNYLHRWAGRLVVLSVNLHALGYFAIWSQNAGGIAAEMDTNIIWGCVALGAMNILFLFSLTAVRQTCYQLFFVSHVVSAIVVLFGTVYHFDWALPYAIIASVLYGFDRLVRMIQTRITSAHLRPIPELGMTRIEIPSVNAGWRAGDHVRIRVLSAGMGTIGWAESHPFTIANVSKNRNGEGLVLLCKKAGDWTSRLYDTAMRSEYGEAPGIGRTVKVVLNGPYGGPGHAMVTSFSGAMLVAGGSGITYALATVQEMLQKSTESASHVRVIELVWSVTDPSALFPMLPLFNTLLSDAQSTYTSLRISVHYTRAIISADVLKPFERLPLGLTLSPGRPKLLKILEGISDRTGQSNGVDGTLTGVLAGVCGPAALGEEVGKAVRHLDGDRRRAVGGVELHEEIFGW